MVSEDKHLFLIEITRSPYCGALIAVVLSVEFTIEQQQVLVVSFGARDKPILPDLIAVDKTAAVRTRR